MGFVLLMDDEPLSRQRLFEILSGPHEVAAPEGLARAFECLQEVGNSLDLLVIDASMVTGDVLDRCALACPRAQLLILTPRPKNSHGEHGQLRKPFTDEVFLHRVNVVMALGATAKPAHSCQPQDRGFRAQAAG